MDECMVVKYLARSLNLSGTLPWSVVSRLCLPLASIRFCRTWCTMTLATWWMLHNPVFWVMSLCTTPLDRLWEEIVGILNAFCRYLYSDSQKCIMSTRSSRPTFIRPCSTRVLSSPGQRLSTPAQLEIATGIQPRTWRCVRCVPTLRRI